MAWGLLHIIGMKVCKDSPVGGKREKQGFTLVESMVASTLVAGAVTILFTSMIMFFGQIDTASNYLAAQGMCFDRMWMIYNRPLSDFENITVASFEVYQMPDDSVIGTAGVIRVSITPFTNRWEIQANALWPQRMAGAMRIISNGYVATRYRTDRFQ